mmetsp:Transcript_1260/g.2045  ORF Transcript_1260/g.2045 Transcript_1260/m.2045 type:complete len:91 (-) Transcript_1260:108-380(-)
MIHVPMKSQRTTSAKNALHYQSMPCKSENTHEHTSPQRNASPSWHTVSPHRCAHGLYIPVLSVNTHAHSKTQHAPKKASCHGIDLIYTFF